MSPCHCVTTSWLDLVAPCGSAVRWILGALGALRPTGPHGPSPWQRPVSPPGKCRRDSKLSHWSKVSALPLIGRRAPPFAHLCRARPLFQPITGALSLTRQAARPMEPSEERGHPHLSEGASSGWPVPEEAGRPSPPPPISAGWEGGASPERGGAAPGARGQCGGGGGGDGGRGAAGRRRSAAPRAAVRGGR